MHLVVECEQEVSVPSPTQREMEILNAIKIQFSSLRTGVTVSIIIVVVVVVVWAKD